MRRTMIDDVKMAKVTRSKTSRGSESRFRRGIQTADYITANVMNGGEILTALKYARQDLER